MAREIIMAAGGIVVRREATPLFAVVCMRKRGDWVLPKGKLDHGETPLDAARREVLEETGQATSVQQYLGTLAYPLGEERTKVVHFWHMEADGRPPRKLMKDIAEVAWLPLDQALRRLTRNHEHAFLAQVGPMVLAAMYEAAAPAEAAPQIVESPPVVPPIPVGPSPEGWFAKLRRWLNGSAGPVSSRE
ncbi:NUDIX domain-containing protein [Rhodopseudomonas boonkerdii]|uniref:NUDIX hydrolase n=1 Tax=Rhodopseudomonas boonkerdii TaxID=475937 RepID=UPI001E470560|nr:NUDIX domain-containing protein [Rhodopseudomonas boonkerdii]UGV25016.1 NUDIX domain-containing protein [Rhodopseudomonas boonkerdii]